MEKMDYLLWNTEIRTIDWEMPKTKRPVLRKKKSSVVNSQGREARARAYKRYPTCALRVPISYSRMSVRTHNAKLSVRKSNLHRYHKIVQRRQQRDATNCIEEVVFHWRVVRPFWLCTSSCCVVQDILRRPALVSIVSKSRLTFSSQLRQSKKIPNRGHSTTKSGRSAVCYAGRVGAEGRM